MFAQLFLKKAKIDFIGGRYISFFIGGGLVIGTIILLLTRGLNLGIDFAGGAVIEIQTKKEIRVKDIRDVFDKLPFGAANIQEFGQADDITIRIASPKTMNSKEAISLIREKLKDKVVEFRRIEFVGPSVGADLQRSSMIALFLSLAGIMFYVWIRFEWQFGVGALIALSHDVFTTLGLFSLLQLDFNQSSQYCLRKCR